MDLITLEKDNLFQRQRNNYPNTIKYFNMDGISSDNEYIPLFAPLTNLGVYERKIVHYSVLQPMGSITHPSNYDSLYHLLKVGTVNGVFQTSSMFNPVYVSKGMLYCKDSVGNPNILFLIAFKSDYLIKLMTEDRSSPDLSKFVIFISKDFITEDKHKNIYRRVNKEIIIPHLERGVDVITTNNIVDKCFKNKMKIPKFRSVIEMKEYLATFNSAIYE